VQNWTDSTSRYLDDKILIGLGDVWEDWGIFAAGHEYGHAYHKKALGGFTSGTCPSSGHSLNQRTGNVQCAWAEGFADFFGAATRRAALGSTFAIDSNLEDNVYFPGRNFETGAISRDGALIEGAVAAFLYDIVDDASWPDGPANAANGDEDLMAYGGKYLADVIATCANQMPVVSFPTTSYQWQNEYHIGMLDNCLENRVSPPPPQPTLNLGGAIAQRESATEPAGWSPTTLRNNWTWNLMTKP
jgi:hypothetical protein